MYGNTAPAANTLFGLGAPTTAFSPPKWIHVVSRFSKFLENINPTDDQLDDFKTKVAGIGASLDRNYWPNKGQNDVSTILTGSWDKRTNVRLSSDVDLIYLLPWSERDRFAARNGNVQSQILQEVKNVLLGTYPNTPIMGDGPVVVADFSTYKVEIIPSFRDGQAPVNIDDEGFKVWVCHTKNDGRFAPAAPIAERGKILAQNLATKGNLVALIRMAKIWKWNCNVPIKSVALEQIAMGFLLQYSYATNSLFWYDWMMRDFFNFMLAHQNSWARLPVSNEVILCGSDWASRAETAYGNAQRACEHETANHNALAGEEWQKIFGTFIPKEA
jgi:hypothetical protein